MMGLVGIVVVFVMVFGGYMLAGGNLMIIMKALPFELMMIGGAAVGAFLIANDMTAIKLTAKDIKKIFKGPKWEKSDYNDLLCLLFELINLSRTNPVAIEQHIDNPNDSDIFGKYPRILEDVEATDLIGDTMRAAASNYDDPHQVEEVLDKRMEASVHHALHSSHSLQNVADALPALGIVAAVLGVIKTMSSIDQPPEVLGKMIGGALVGTFLGVFLAYGFVGPFSAKLKVVVEDESNFYKLIREVLIASLHHHSPSICIEVGRQNIPITHRPSFSALEVQLKEIKKAA